MYCRFSNPTLVTHLASYALGRSPQYMVLYISHILMHWGDDPSTPDFHYYMSVHYTVLQADEPTALIKILQIAHSCIYNRVTHECRSPYACFPHHRLTSYSHITCMHVQCKSLPRFLQYHHPACSPSTFHAHLHPWGFPCLIPSLPHMLITTNSLTIAFAAPLQRYSP